MTISFEPLNKSHFPLLLKWLELPQVKKWWDQDVLYTMDLVQEKFSRYIHQAAISKDLHRKIYAYIVCFGKEKIGYVQAYDARNFAQEDDLDLSSIGGSVAGIDLFIGETNYLYKGIGSLILNALEEQILAPHFNWCIIDPLSNNEPAIKAFEKAGFKKLFLQESTGKIYMTKKLNQNTNPKIGLGVLIFNKNNQILLGKRKNSHGTSSWGPPGGHLEFGESFEECAIRETAEETGLIIDNPTFLAITNDIFEAEGKHYVSIFMRADLTDNQTVKNLEPDKVEDWHWFSLDELPEPLFLPLKQLSSGFAYGNALSMQHSQILEELKLREPIFHHPDKFGKTEQDILAQICTEFWEVGASGNVYTKQTVIDTLVERYNDLNYQDIWETSDFKLTQIAPDHYLLTYLLVQNKTRRSRRSTIWRKCNGQWKILYHQGTVIDEAWLPPR